ncbi:hypothetical protein THAOC_23036, partial [Thalassiosira oceanica]
PGATAFPNSTLLLKFPARVHRLGNEVGGGPGAGMTCDVPKIVLMLPKRHAARAVTWERSGGAGLALGSRATFVFDVIFRVDDTLRRPVARIDSATRTTPRAEETHCLASLVGRQNWERSAGQRAYLLQSRGFKIYGKR